MIHEAIDQSVKTKKLANAIDTKIFSVIGAGACFALVAAVGILTSQNGLDDPHVLRGALFAAVVGGVIGRWIAKQKDRI